MFTGIIEETGVIQSATANGGGKEFAIACSFAKALKVDESISINGACHTVVAAGKEHFKVQSIEETIRKTNIGDLGEGDRVNLERSMTMEKLLDGHLVQGHVDTTGTIISIKNDGSGRLITIQYPAEFSKLIVPRGSVTLDGISLTLASIGNDRFTVAIIPHTWEKTNIQLRSEGDRLNIEFDILGKYVARHLHN